MKLTKEYFLADIKETVTSARFLGVLVGLSLIFASQVDWEEVCFQAQNQLSNMPIFLSISQETDDCFDCLP